MLCEFLFRVTIEAIRNASTSYLSNKLAIDEGLFINDIYDIFLLILFKSMRILDILLDNENLEIKLLSLF